MGILDCSLPGICLLWKQGEVGGGRELPQLGKGSDVPITPPCAPVCCSSSPELVGIQYNRFLKCAFLQHDFFLKLL